MENTLEEMTELGTEIFENGIEVQLNLGAKEVVGVIAISAAAATITWTTLSIMSAIAKHSLAKAQKNTEEAS